MIPIKGLSADMASIHYRDLPGKRSTYVSAFMLCMWDNIHGPKILSVWRNNDSPTEDSSSSTATSSPSFPSQETLLSIAIHSLNNEPGRTEKMSDIESKFFVLRKYNIIAGAFIFSIEVNHGRLEVFSFILVLPYTEMTNYLTRFALFEQKTQAFLENHLRGYFKENSTKFKSQTEVKEYVLEKVKKLDQEVLHLAQLMYSVRYNCPQRAELSQTFLGKELENQGMRKFLEFSITSHLQTSGRTIVLGRDEESVLKMMNTLALFLSEEERHLSRLPTPISASREEDKDHIIHHYEPDLFLQGFVMPLDVPLPMTWGEMLRNHLPPSVIHVNAKEVWLVEKNIPCFIKMKDEDERKSKKNIELKELTLFRDEVKDLSSRLVSTFIDRLKLLPIHGGVREVFLSQFMRLLKLKALAMVKYLDAEPKPAHAGEQLAGMLALNRGPEKPRVPMETLQQDLCLECDGDMHIVLAIAEKMRHNTYIDVLGDPQLHCEAVIKEFEAF